MKFRSNGLIVMNFRSIGLIVMKFKSNSLIVMKFKSNSLIVMKFKSNNLIVIKFKINEHGEGLQILHYEVDQKYEPHFDYFLDEFNTKNGGQRIATVLISDVEEGGETIFPSAKVNSSSLPYYNELSECGKRGLAVKPQMGDALLFWSMRPDATLDPTSLHGVHCVFVRQALDDVPWRGSEQNMSCNFLFFF
ncbi:hypothetical protein Taro_017290 [Colocasia esculenta]|uniref:Fe2OG dioxygenase domain-containing protein n=1 Tax=Colocasia esculenta TaxID=4460 RepID=A0A843UN69_COLES|nr:hypothetical protein [Colocasia esculenta]